MGRGRHAHTKQFMDAIYAVAAAWQPITIRGIAYQLFTHGVIAWMAANHVQKVSRVATTMREEGTLPWAWIADATRAKEQPPCEKEES